MACPSWKYIVQFARPCRFSAWVAYLLGEDGLILVQTGYGGDLESAEVYPEAMLLPDHLGFAGERHVIGILERIGYQVEAIEWNPMDASTYAFRCLVKWMLSRPPA